MKTKKLVSAEDVGAEVIRLSGIYIHNLGILVGAKAVIPLRVKSRSVGSIYRKERQATSGAQCRMRFHERRRRLLEICVRSNQKLVEVWLTREERQDTALREELKVLYQTYRAKSFLVAVFQSGGQSLADATSGLLCHNRKRLAQLEARGAGFLTREADKP
ncbi:hypothetical protein SDC9_68373 [bioreactor metagenome]|uniref:Uncharacterized protein n=1 Tax=bioreactor metagenome TaxID=1076179 RepID=A0A644Y5T9_9ZZZZ